MKIKFGRIALIPSLVSISLISMSSYAAWYFPSQGHIMPAGCFPSPEEACRTVFPDRETPAYTSCNNSYTRGDGVLQESSILGRYDRNPSWYTCQGRAKLIDICGDTVYDTLSAPVYIAEADCSPKYVYRYHKKANQCEDPSVGNPILPLSGAKRQEQRLISNPLQGVEAFSIWYDSTPKLPVGSGSGFDLKPLSDFGGLWHSNLHKSITIQYDLSNNPVGLQVSKGGGEWISFESSDWGWVSDPGVSDRISASSGFVYFDSNTNARESYDPNGRLLRINPSNGGELNFFYSDSSTSPDIASDSGMLIKISDNFSRQINFYYIKAADGTQLVSRMSNSGREYKFEYDANANLTKIIWPDLSSRTFLYENPSLPWALTGILNENGIRSSTYEYKSNGLAISTEGFGGIERYSVSYSDQEPMWTSTDTSSSDGKIIYRDFYLNNGGGVQVTSPDLSVAKLEGAMIGGSSRLISQSQPAGSGCSSSSTSMTYFPDGKLKSKIDFAGNLSCYSYDSSRNLEISRVEGIVGFGAEVCDSIQSANSIPAGARKITQAWHSDFSLISKKSEPGKITYYVYDGQPDPTYGNSPASCAIPNSGFAFLCKTVELATTDSNGAVGLSAVIDNSTPSRIVSWIYDVNGKITMKSRNVASGIINDYYTYYRDTTDEHSMGDLASVQNSLGHITSFNRYTKSGQVARLTDPNGVIREFTYDYNGRMLSESVMGLVSKFNYDAVGNLKQALFPDGYLIKYGHDESGRPINITDSSGNEISYSYDGGGNVVGKSIQDASGMLTMRLINSYDALNRKKSQELR